MVVKVVYSDVCFVAKQDEGNARRYTDYRAVVADIYTTSRMISSIRPFETSAQCHNLINDKLDIPKKFVANYDDACPGLSRNL